MNVSPSSAAQAAREAVAARLTDLRKTAGLKAYEVAARADAALEAAGYSAWTVTGEGLPAPPPVRCTAYAGSPHPAPSDDRPALRREHRLG